ncbi:MAG: hypothetical protein ACRELB_10610 [Polyangiaceae bacterium]
MNLARRSGAPSAFACLLGFGLGVTCTMTACSATSGSQSSGWLAQSGGGPLGSGGGNGGASSGATGGGSGGGGGAEASAPSSGGGADAGATGDASDEGTGATASGDASSDGAPTLANDGAPLTVPPDFSLVNTTLTGLVDGIAVPGFDPMTEGSVVDLAKVGSALSVRANLVPAVVGSVAFALDGTYTHTENITPYFLCADDGAGTITSCANILTVGKHTLSATPYSGAGLTGDAGAAVILDFTVVDGVDAGGQ